MGRRKKRRSRNRRRSYIGRALATVGLMALLFGGGVDYADRQASAGGCRAAIGMRCAGTNNVKPLEYAALKSRQFLEDDREKKLAAIYGGGALALLSGGLLCNRRRRNLYRQ